MEIKIQAQPDEETCGPTSLHAVYEYYQDDISLEQVITETERLATGGTISSMLGQHALARGYDAEMYVYNVNIFDPTWFVPKPLSMPDLAAKLSQQIQYKENERFAVASLSYIRFIELGGTIRFVDLTPELLAEYFLQKCPIITGLSSTYLYQTARELVEGADIFADDVRGTPAGHFVVLCGQDETQKTVKVADPYCLNPLSKDHYYIVDSLRLIHAIMLGVLTYDANLLILKPRRLS